MKGLPSGVSYTVVYDRSALIQRAVGTLKEKLLEESIVVALVCGVFLLHWRSAFVIILFLSIAVLASFLVMFGQGLSSNIMSLGGIAIAIGAMVDAAIIMIENAHKHLERDQGRKPHWEIIRDASLEVGPALFYSLLVITISFIPVLTLQEQEGRLFKPLAFTKTYAMGAATLLSLTLVPVLIGFFIRGRIPAEEKNLINRSLIWVYHLVMDVIIERPWHVILTAGALVLWVFLPWNKLATHLLPEGPAKAWALGAGRFFPCQNIGSEFMPPLYEGDLLYMPTTFPGISPAKAREVLQVTDALIRRFAEVDQVFGKIGRAETATDPAPFDMIETTVTLKPAEEWPLMDIQDRRGKIMAHRRRTPEELVEALDAAVRIPGLNNAWTMPIRTRIDMLATGIKTPVGIKIAGQDLGELERIAAEVEAVLEAVPGTAGAFAERTMGGNYIEFNIDRDAITRYGMTVGDVQEVLQAALGGVSLTTTVHGLERYDVTLRYSRDFRKNLRALRQIVVPTRTGAQIPLGELAKIEMVRGPMSIKSEGAVPNAWIYVDVKGVDLAAYVQRARQAVNEGVRKGTIQLPGGYDILWSGQYEYLVRAQDRLMIIVPITLLLIILILYLNTRSAVKTAIVLLAVPFSLVGAFATIYWLGYNMSVAVWVGLIALLGLDAETGVIMLLYLDQSWERFRALGRMNTTSDLRLAIMEGAVQRVRPKAMTICAILFGLLPIMWSPLTQSGADVMKRIAAPMIGGVITSGLLELLLYPVIFFLWRLRHLPKSQS